MIKTYQIVRVTSPGQLEDHMRVRRTVFVQEQGVPAEIEFDQHDREDEETLHFVAYDAFERPVGASRLRTYAPGMGKVERVAVLQTERGTGLGKQIMQVMEEAAREAGFTQLKLNAQTHAQGFYEKLGYEPYGELFEEAGIPHIAMKKTLAAK
jgi:predicted GNAT family N-acyltransferase